MQMSTVFEVSVPPDRVAAFLANPRNLILANHPRPVLESSDGPVADGSWFVIGLDQLRARVEYERFDPPRRIVVRTSLTGRGSAGTKATMEYLLSPVPAGRGTRVAASIDAEGALVRLRPLMRVSQALWWRRLRNNIEAAPREAV